MSNVFYLPANDLFGVWANGGDNAASPEFKEGVSVFKFTQIGDTSAEFAVCEDISAQRAIMGGLRRGWTSSVCDSKEFAPANATGVSMNTAGKAELQADGSWKATVKAIIEYTT